MKKIFKKQTVEEVRLEELADLSKDDLRFLKSKYWKDAKRFPLPVKNLKVRR